MCQGFDVCDTSVSHVRADGQFPSSAWPRACMLPACMSTAVQAVAIRAGGESLGLAGSQPQPRFKKKAKKVCFQQSYITWVSPAHCVAYLLLKRSICSMPPDGCRSSCRIFQHIFTAHATGQARKPPQCGGHLAARQTTMMSKAAHVIAALFTVQVNILCYAYWFEMKSCPMCSKTR